MTGDIRIDTVNVSVGNLVVAPDASLDGIWDFLREQIQAGADPAIMREDGYPVPEEVGEPDDTPTPEEQDQLDQARAEGYLVISRANLLRNVVSHVTPARKLEGFQTSHERHPRKPSAVDIKQAREVTDAQESLEKACARCVFQNDCKMKDNVQMWMNVHPYKSDKTGKRRPGSSPVKEVESQEAFLESLAAGVAQRRQVHCDPSKRK